MTSPRWVDGTDLGCFGLNLEAAPGRPKVQILSSRDPFSLMVLTKLKLLAAAWTMLELRGPSLSFISYKQLRKRNAKHSKTNEMKATYECHCANRISTYHTFCDKKRLMRGI